MESGQRVAECSGRVAVVAVAVAVVLGAVGAGQGMIRGCSLFCVSVTYHRSL